RRGHRDRRSGLGAVAPRRSEARCGLRGASYRDGVAFGGVTHVALRVTSLPEAERFYQELFGLDVAFREIEQTDGWRTLPEGMGWDDARSAGLEPGMCVLFAGGFRLALEQTSDIAANGSLDHVGLLVADSDLR